MTKSSEIFLTKAGHVLIKSFYSRLLKIFHLRKTLRCFVLARMTMMESILVVRLDFAVMKT